MAFEFVTGPIQTTRSIEEIGDVIKRIGTERKFMGLARRIGTGSMSAGSYGAFVPQLDDDPFAATRQTPDAQVGWQWGMVVTNSMGMTLNQGWRVVFEIFRGDSVRSVTARVSGLSQRSEVEKFVKSVFGGL